MIRDVGLASASISSFNGNRVEKAKLIVKYEKAIKELNENIPFEPIYGKTGKIFKMWQNAEESIFSLSRLDGKLSMNEFWKMNVYEFMRYKQMLIKELKHAKKIK